MSIEDLKKHKFIVFAIDHYNPLGVIRSLGEEGINPIFIGIEGKAPIASKSKYVSSYYYVKSVEEGYELLVSKFFDEEELPFLFYSDDKTIGLLDNHYDELKKHFIMFNAGSSGNIIKHLDKYYILQVAKECGLNILDTWKCKVGEIPEELPYPIITKSISPNVGGWKSDVYICNNEKELLAAYREIKAHTVIIQPYIDKKNELEFHGFTIDKGNDLFLSMTTTYNYLIPGYYSPYMTVAFPDDNQMNDKIAYLMKAVGYEGVFDAEFLVAQDGTLYFQEINFRNVTWTYASTCAGMNLPFLWAKSTLEGKIKQENAIAFEPFNAMVEPIDYGKRVDTNSISLAEWLRDFKEAKCTFYYNSKDQEPYQSLFDNWDLLK